MNPESTAVAEVLRALWPYAVTVLTLVANVALVVCFWGWVTGSALYLRKGAHE